MAVEDVTESKALITRSGRAILGLGCPILTLLMGHRAHSWTELWAFSATEAALAALLLFAAIRSQNAIVRRLLGSLFVVAIYETAFHLLSQRTCFFAQDLADASMAHDKGVVFFNLECGWTNRDYYLAGLPASVIASIAGFGINVSHKGLGTFSAAVSLVLFNALVFAISL